VRFDLFRREFSIDNKDSVTVPDPSDVETQEAVGANVIGTFRDLDDPDRFVSLRGFRVLVSLPLLSHAQPKH
jgi:hypothetical protein